jgi:hypothetical protein
MPTNKPQPIPPGMERPPGLPTSPPPPRVPYRTEMVSVCVDDLRKLTALTRELAAHVRELEGETPSTEECQRYVTRTIARVEKSI